MQQKNMENICNVACSNVEKRLNHTTQAGTLFLPKHTHKPSQTKPSYKDTAVQLQPYHFKHKARRARGAGREWSLYLMELAEGGYLDHTSVVQYLTDLWPLDTQYMKEQGQTEGLFHTKTVKGVQCVMFSGLLGHRWAVIIKFKINALNKGIGCLKQNNIPHCYTNKNIRHAVIGK